MERGSHTGSSVYMYCFALVQASYISGRSFFLVVGPVDLVADSGIILVLAMVVVMID